MIVEGVVTTCSIDGIVNVAPMGPMLDVAVPPIGHVFLLRPFEGSQTLANLKEIPEGVFHVTDDAALIARAVLGEARPALSASSRVRPARLADACRWIEFVVDHIDEGEPRATLTARVACVERGREFLGFNRAKHAVLEAAILASRVHLLDADYLRAEFDRLRPLVQKTAGPSETEAFALLESRLFDLTAE